MSIIEAAVEIRNQSDDIAGAYLWMLFLLVILCVVMGIIEIVKTKG